MSYVCEQYVGIRKISGSNRQSKAPDSAYEGTERMGTFPGHDAGEDKNSTSSEVNQ